MATVLVLGTPGTMTIRPVASRVFESAGFRTMVDWDLPAPDELSVDAVVFVVSDRPRLPNQVRRGAAEKLLLEHSAAQAADLRQRGIPSAALVESRSAGFVPSGAGAPQGPFVTVAHFRPGGLPSAARAVAERLRTILPAEAHELDLRLHPPVERPEPDDAVVIGSEIESLLTWAERYVADEANPEDLRDEVDTRRRQLWDELRLIEQGKGRSSVLTGLSGALLDVVRPEPAEEEGLGAALDEVANGVVALGRAASDDERVEAGEEVVAALDHVGEEVAEIVEANGWEDLRASMWRTAGAWVEEDFRAHLNAFITLYRERAPGPGGAAGGAVGGLAGGPPWLAVTIVAAGLLRSLFPWISPRRTPPEDPPPEQG